MSFLRRSLAAAVIMLCLLVGCVRPAADPIEVTSKHWLRPTYGAVISSPVAYDWEGDDQLEIAVGSWDGFFYLLDNKLRSLDGWPKYSRRGYFGSPALCDLDGDGRPEILIGADVGKLFAWRFDGSNVPGFPVPLGYRTWASPTILPDRQVAIAGFGRMHRIDSQGRPIPNWPVSMANWADATAAVGSDLLVVSTLLVGRRTEGALCAWHLDGRRYDWSPLRLRMDSDSSPAIADLDGNGEIEIIFGDDEGLLHVIGLDGRERPGFPQRAESLIEASPAIADLDGDGMLDIAVGAWDARMYVWNHRGELLPGWPVQVGDHIISSAALVDVSADGRPDIIVGSKDNKLYGWHSWGEPLDGFPYDLGDHVFSSPWVGDLDGDGRADIVVGANNGIHLLRNVGPLGIAPWPMFHRDAQHSGYVP